MKTSTKPKKKIIINMLRKEAPYYYVNAYLDVSALVPKTTETAFEYTLYFNKENSLDYLHLDDPSTYRQFQLIHPVSTITDVAVYTNPVINQTDFEASVAFDEINVVLFDDVSTTPTFTPEPFLNLTIVQKNLGTLNLNCVAIDPTQTFAYFGSMGVILKVNLITLTIVDKLAVFLPSQKIASSYAISTAAIDRTGEFGYFATEGGLVLKVDLRTFTVTKYMAITNDSTNLNVLNGILEPSGDFFYAISSTLTSSGPCKIHKIETTTLTITNTLDLSTTTNNTCTTACYYDPNFLILVLKDSGTLFKINLVSLTVDSSITLLSTDGRECSCVSGNFGYFAGGGLSGATPSQLVKVRLDTSPPTRIGALVLVGDAFLTPVSGITAVTASSTSLYAACVTGSGFDRIVNEVDLSTFTQVNNRVLVETSASANSRQYITATFLPVANRVLIASASLGSSVSTDRILTLIPSPLNVDRQIESPTGVQVITSGGNVNTAKTIGYWGGQPATRFRGSSSRFRYFLYQFDLADMNLLNTLELTTTLATPMVTSVLDSAGTFFYAGMDANSTSTQLIYKINTSSPLSITGTITRVNTETAIVACAIHPNGLYAYFAVNASSPSDRKLLQINLGAFTRGPAVSLSAYSLYSFTYNRIIAIDPTGTYLYLLVTNGLLQFRVDTATPVLVGFTSLTSTFVRTAYTFAMTPDGLRLYVRDDQSAEGIQEVDLSSGTPQITERFTREITPFFSAGVVTGSTVVMSDSSDAYYVGNPFYTQTTIEFEKLDGERFEVAAYRIPYAFANLLITAPVLVNGYLYAAQSAGGGLVRINTRNDLLSGLSNPGLVNTGASLLVNTTEQVDVDFQSQIVKRVVNTPLTVIARKYVGLYIRGRTGRVLNPNEYKIHVRIKVYPN